MSQTRLRYGPSPSGDQHIAGLRTALYNWAIAKQSEGKFIIRIEDTDADRSSPKSIKAILDALRWAGLDWNEGAECGGDYGPYFQSQRIDIYQCYANKLIESGRAYRCYCTDDEIATKREAWTKANPKIGFKYDRHCLNRKDRPNLPFVVRFLAKTDGITSFKDRVYGKVNTPNCEASDWIIIRSDGQSMFTFAGVIDDHLMGITTVSRGVDHLQNTPIQLQFYEALNWTPPEFCHLGLIRGKDNEKLSKRNASVGVFQYRDQGYSPSAILNYIARLGWSKGNAEVFSPEEFVEMFSWDGCINHDSKFDPDKFAAINYAHLKSDRLTPTPLYAQYTKPFLLKLGLDVPLEQIERAVPIIRSRAKTFVEAASMLDCFFRSEPTIDPVAASQFLTATTKPKLQGVYKLLAATEQWDEITLKTNINSWLAGMKMPMSEIGQPMRVAITGKTQSPDLFAVMNVLGKTTTLERLAKQI